MKRNAGNVNNIAQEIKKILNDRTDFSTVETYKSIRTNIMFSMPKSEKGRVIVVTSSAPGEGKTTTSINLAITFAQTGARVILLDCDLRKSRVHRYLQCDRKIGISNVVCGFSELDSAIKRNVRMNLDCLTAGEIPPNPAELLQTEEFNKMISDLKEKYDYVIVDTPPMTVVTDAAVIMKKDVGVVVVVRENITTYDLLDITMENIRKTGAKMLGVIMLDCNKKSKKYRYYRKNKNYKKNKYGYSHVYGYGYSYNDDQDDLV